MSCESSARITFDMVTAKKTITMVGRKPLPTDSC
jgi:hypothetical protein